MMTASLLAMIALAQTAPIVSETPAAQVLTEVNQVRVKAGLGKLAFQSQLMKASQVLADDLAKRKVLEHKDGRGWELQARIEEAGYTSWTSIGENIAYGQKTPKEVVAAWLKSPGHREMIFTPEFRDTGIGVAKTPKGVIYWVQQFGTTIPPKKG